MRFDKDTRKLLAVEGGRTEGCNLQQARMYQTRLGLASTRVDAMQQLAESGEVAAPGVDSAAHDAQIAALASAHADVILEALKAIASLGLSPSGVLSIRRDEALGGTPLMNMASYVQAERLLAARKAAR